MKKRKEAQISVQDTPRMNNAIIEKGVDLISKTWGEQGAYIHTLQEQRLKTLMAECRSTLEDRRAVLHRPDVPLLDKPCNVRPSLQLDIRRAKAFRDGDQLPRIDGVKQGSQTERLAKCYAPTQSLQVIMKDKVERRLWLRDTGYLSMQGSLAPFTLPPREAPERRHILPSDKIDNEAQFVRHESKRITSILHTLNCSLRKGSKYASMSKEDRNKELKMLQSDLSRFDTSVTLLADAMGADREGLSPRYDFICANKHMLKLNNKDMRRARAIRQSILHLEMTEHTLLQSNAREMQRCQTVAAAIVARSKKATQRLNAGCGDDAVIGKQQTMQQLWLERCFVALATVAMLEAILGQRKRIKQMAAVIQKIWRGYWVRSWVKRQTVIMKLAVQMPKLAKQARSRVLDTSADIIRTFIIGIKDNLAVRKAIRSFRRRTILLQRCIRDHLKHVKALRTRYLAHFERVEKALLHKLVREKAQAREHKNSAATAEAEAGGGRGAQRKRRDSHPDMDWSKMTTELGRIQVSDDIKNAMCNELVKMKKAKYILQKRAWREEMAVYKASLRQTLLFRTEMQEILAGTGLEHMENNLELLAGNNKGVRELFKNMNRVLPAKPVFNDSVSDDKMRELVKQCLHLCAGRNLSIRLLLIDHVPPDTVVPPPVWLKKQLAWESKTVINMENPERQAAHL